MKWRNGESLILVGMRKVWLLLGLVLLGTGVWGQGFDYRTGAFALGLRTTGNYFLDNEMQGLGAGGQFKVGFTPRVNTEWFLDYIQSRGEHGAYRQDYHIGWSVLFGLSKEGFGSKGVTPYVLGGQCFDLTRAGFTNGGRSPLVFSAAVQAGAGVSAFISPRLELNLQAQYMVHLRKDLHVEYDATTGGHFHIHRGLNFKGHLLMNLSMNFYLFHLWRG